MLAFALLLTCLIPGQTCAGGACLSSCQVPDRPAVLVVRCPADAVLTVDGVTMRQTGPLRTLHSPPLPAGRTFVYDVRAYRAGAEVARRHLEFQAGETLRLDLTPGAPEPVPELPVTNFGIDTQQLAAAAGDRLTINGTPVTRPEADQLIQQGGLPDLSRRRRLTVIGNPAARQRVLADLAGPLHDLAADFVIQDYAPDHWAVARTGFKTDGDPTVYAQEPDGTVLFRQDDAADLRRNLEAVRKPNPDYRPDRDPDARRTPAVDEDSVVLLLGLGAAALVVMLMAHRGDSWR